MRIFARFDQICYYNLMFRTNGMTLVPNYRESFKEFLFNYKLNLQMQFQLACISGVEIEIYLSWSSQIPVGKWKSVSSEKWVNYGTGEQLKREDLNLLSYMYTYVHVQLQRQRFKQFHWWIKHHRNFPSQRTVNHSCQIKSREFSIRGPLPSAVDHNGAIDLTRPTIKRNCNGSNRPSNLQLPPLKINRLLTNR